MSNTKSNGKVTIIGSDKQKVTIIINILDVFKFIGKKVWGNESTQ